MSDIIIQQIAAKNFSGSAVTQDITTAGNNRAVVSLWNGLRTGALVSYAATLGGVAPSWTREERVDSSNDYITEIDIWINPPVNTLQYSSTWTGAVGSAAYGRLAVIALSNVLQYPLTPADTSEDKTKVYSGYKNGSMSFGTVSYGMGNLGADQTLATDASSDRGCWYTLPSASYDGQITATWSGNTSSGQTILLLPASDMCGAIIF